MSNEAVQVLRTEDPVDMIVLDAHAYPKGTLMQLSGSSTIGRTVKSGSALGQRFGGISRREKITPDGRTRLSCFFGGIFRLKAAGSAITAGDLVCISGSNLIASIRRCNLSGSDLLDGITAGKALEDFAASETKEVWVGKT